MSRKKEKDAGEPENAAPFNNPFAALKSKLGTLPEAPRAPAASAPVPQGPARAVVRLERKGHGGKEVTVVSHLELRPSEQEKWLKALKSALGCGGSLGDGGELWLQGDQRERVEPLLRARGVRKVTQG
jgi:translation initiation factor 1